MLPKQIGHTALDSAALAKDKKTCRRFGPCGLGTQALYLGSLWGERRLYVRFCDLRRVFKRVAMSRGGFSGKGLFGSIPYLVVEFADGTQRACRFRFEEQLDALLAAFAREHPHIPVHSAAAEQRLREAEEAERARYLKELSPQAEAAVAHLRAAQEKLGPHSEACDALAFAARRKRTADASGPTWRFVAAAIALLALGAAALGAYLLPRAQDKNEPVMLFCFAALFAIMFLRVLPTARSSRSFAQRQWDAALGEMRALLRGTDFPVPPQYAHGVVLERMIRVLREGRAEDEREAYERMKADLKALNASVTVSQKEHDEVVRIKPLFLVCGYADE